jgi:hypothetical protein
VQTNLTLNSSTPSVSSSDILIFPAVNRPTRDLQIDAELRISSRYAMH